MWSKLVITAGWSQLKSAFWQHINAIGSHSGPSYNLLKFYGVECGLKAIYLQRNKFRTTRQIPDERVRGSHHLADLAKVLRLPAAVIDANSDFHLQHDRSSWSVDKLHQAWRYGVKVEPDDEQRVVDWLERLVQWIQENI